MTAREILRAAMLIVEKDHTATQLAVNAAGEKVQPLDPDAISWSTTGALCKVAPSHAKAPSPQHISTALDAYELLTEAAMAIGYLNVSQVDKAGPSEVLRMFWRALHDAGDEPEPRRRTFRRGAGAHPRGAVA